MEKYRILFVDASAQFIRLNKTLIELEAMPVSAHYVLDPPSAVAYLQSLPEDEFPHLIIADVYLPFYSGIDLAKRLAVEFPTLFPQCQYFLTTSSEIARKVLDPEKEPLIEGLLPKPFNREVLQQCVGKLTINEEGGVED